MTLPVATDLQTLDFTFKGLPFAYVEAKSSIGTSSLDFMFQGLPFVAATAAGAAPSFNATRMMLIF